ncbi:MAG TPA: FlgD immunoglobulin-like domain containing protein [Candidatus Eisenbacteria bacterium]|nr:FlgD immunoglobulin-like domain containing protein [Candidatus Eisenbacteria bacterium]
MKRTFAGFVLALGLAAVPAAQADNWSVSLSAPSQVASPGGTATYSGTITNTSGSSIAFDAAIDFLGSPATEDITINFSSGFLGLGLVVPTSGYSGPLFDVTWGSSVPGGTSAVGHLQLNTLGAATPGAVASTFTLRTPGVGSFCTQGTGLVAGSSSIASHDSNDVSTPRIAWHDPAVGTIGYAALVGGTWSSTPVAAGIGNQAAPALILDADNLPHILYYDSVLGDLVYARNTTGVWTFETVDATGNVGMAPSFARDQYDQLHACYYDATNGDLKYALRSDGMWTVESVDTTGNMGSTSSITVTETGIPHVSYYDATLQDLRYATKSGGVWTKSTLDAAGVVGTWSSIGVDDGKVSIAYRDASVGTPRLRYVSGSGITWSYETVDQAGDPGIGSRLDLNAFGEPRIAYFDQATQRLLYAVKAAGTWSTGVIAGDATGALSLARSELDQPFLSYSLGNGSPLRFASLSICSPTAVGKPAALGPRLMLYPNRPNPFSGGTIITFAVREASAMRVRIFDAAGRLVAEPFQKMVTAGTHRVEWNGTGRSGHRLPSGMYVYEVRSASEVQRGRMVLLR